MLKKPLKSVQKCLTSRQDLKVGKYGTYLSRPCNGDEIQYFTYDDKIVCRVNWTRCAVVFADYMWDNKSAYKVFWNIKTHFQDNYPNMTIQDSFNIKVD